jgi:hypothetical protein
MDQLHRVMLMAEDELTQYSTEARKIERLRQKIALSVSATEQQEVKAALLDLLPKGGLDLLIETQRQTLALPFWGIAGLGLLLGISFQQPLDFLGPILAVPIAIFLQKRGWNLQAKRLALQTLADIEARTQRPN